MNRTRSARTDRTGSGLCAQLGLTERVHFITTSLAKAFAGRAGFFTMPPKRMRYYILTNSFPSHLQLLPAAA